MPQHGVGCTWTNFCYILINNCDNKTYNGYTNNPARRLRQHNGEIRGGARYTTRLSTRRKARDPAPRMWEFLVLIEAEGLAYREALSLEWHLKYPTNRRPRPREFNGANGRLASLPLALGNPKFRGKKFVVHVLDRYYERAVRLLSAPLRERAEGGVDVELRSMPPDVPDNSHLLPRVDPFLAPTTEASPTEQEAAATNDSDDNAEKEDTTDAAADEDALLAPTTTTTTAGFPRETESGGDRDLL